MEGGFDWVDDVLVLPQVQSQQACLPTSEPGTCNKGIKKRMAGDYDFLKSLQNNLQELNHLRAKYLTSRKSPSSVEIKSLFCDQQQLPRENMNIQSLAPRKSIRHRNPYWPDEEIRTFIEIWGDDQVQASLATNFRNEAQYEWISERMREYGYDRDMKQCRLRAKELRRGYKAIVCGNNSSVSGQRALPFYDSLNSFLCMHKGLVVSKVSLSIDRRNREVQKLSLEQEKNEKLSVVLVSDDDEASIPEPTDDSKGYFQDTQMDSERLNAQSPCEEWEAHGEDGLLAGDVASPSFANTRGDGHSISSGEH
uniref:Myb/SANT-like DNA-binding domain-containing protein n=1 Tax=Micrurus corallinus TaxID=54390 RepID=A0A2D4G3I8_MICCO